MNEFLLALWAMTAVPHQWEMPVMEPAPIVRPLETPVSARQLSSRERRELRTAVERTAQCATGKLERDADSGWYVPEQAATGLCAGGSAAGE
jgi:hypothetical protein